MKSNYTPSGSDGSEISYKDLSQKLSSKNCFVLDVRETEELLESGTIKGAHNLPFSEISADSEKFQKFTKQTSLPSPIYVYCARGRRAQIVCDILGKKGFVAQNLGGFSDLKEHMPVSEEILSC